MTPEHEQQIRARLAAITEGPWYLDGPLNPGPGDSLVIYPKQGGTIAYVQPSWDDAEFITKAPTYMADLLAEVDLLRGKLADAWSEGYKAARDAALALVVRDLISKEHYDLLTGPWAQVIGPAHPDDENIRNQENTK